MASTTPRAKKRISSYPGKKRRIAFRRRIRYVEREKIRHPQVGDAVFEKFNIRRDKEPVDKGITLAEKLKEIAGYPENPDYQQNLAQLYVLKGDPAKAEEEYGKDFIDKDIKDAMAKEKGAEVKK